MAITLPFAVKKKIAIVGKAPSSLGLGPYHDGEWDVWTLSDLILCKQIPRYDVHFELHDVALIKQRPAYWEWLQRATHKPLVIRESVPELEGAMPFPIQEIVDRFGTYFTNTVSYLIALAIATEPDEIGIWGIDMAQDEEYQQQRPSVEYFCGLAKGMGITLTIPPQSDLLKCIGLYGFDPRVSDTLAKWKSRISELTARANQCQEEAEAKAQEAMFFRGALDNQKYNMQFVA